VGGGGVELTGKVSITFQEKQKRVKVVQFVASSSRDCSLVWLLVSTVLSCPSKECEWYFSTRSCLTVSNLLISVSTCARYCSVLKHVSTDVIHCSADAGVVTNPHLL